MSETGQELVPNRRQVIFKNWVRISFGSNKDLEYAFVGCNRKITVFKMMQGFCQWKLTNKIKNSLSIFPCYVFASINNMGGVH